MGRAIDARSWRPQDLIDDLQALIDEEQDKYLNDRHTTLCMARDYLKEYFSLPQPSNEPRSPHPDGDTSIFACPRCGSGEYLYNEDGVWNNYCGQCGQRIGWGHPPDRRPPEGEDGDATRG